MIQAVFSDVDGTLLNSHHQLSPATQQALITLGERGVPFVIVSARSPSGILSLLREHRLRCPLIAYSGALMLDERGTLLFHRGFSVEDAQEFLRFLDASAWDVACCVYSFDQWLAKDCRDPRVLLEESIVGAHPQQGGLESLEQPVVHKLLCMGEPETVADLEKRLKQSFPRFTIVRSAEFLLEIMAAGVSKAAAVCKACELWRIPVENVAAFGDNYNDVDMLEAVGHGFLMGNAPGELLERIPLHTEENDRDGVCRGLERLGLL